MLLGHSFLFVFVLAYVMAISCDLAVVTSVIATCLMNIHGSYNGSIANLLLPGVRAVPD